MFIGRLSEWMSQHSRGWSGIRGSGYGPEKFFETETPVGAFWRLQ